MAFDFRTRRGIAGLPWVHVTWGTDPFTGRPKVARGVVAVGPIALGVVAVGPIAVGLICLGQLAAGLGLAFGQVAAAVAAAGQFAFGAVLALGEVAASRTVAAGVVVIPASYAPLLLAAAWLVASAAMCRTWWRHCRRIARILGAGRRIKDSGPGGVLLRGRILPLRTIEAPVSRRYCIGYDVRKVRNNQPPQAERVCEDFFVDDGTGRARVHAANAVLMLDPKDRASQVFENRIVAYADTGTGFSSGRGVLRTVGTAIERVLMPGENVMVAGQALRVLGAGRGSGLALLGGAGAPVLVTNRPLRDVRIELYAWLWLAAALAVAAVGAIFLA